MGTTPQNKYRLGFIGAGKLAGSVIRGLVRAKFCPPGEIIASEPFAETREKLQRETGVSVTTENAAIVEKAETILLGVKPGMVANVVGEIAAQLENRLVISLAAGVDVRSMEAKANARFMRAMTNTPSAICRAVTAIARGARTNDEDMRVAHNIFASIGVVAEVREDQIDAVTALGGSGPAFVYRVIEALADGGVKCGLPADVSLQSNTTDEIRQAITKPGIAAHGRAGPSITLPDDLRCLLGSHRRAFAQCSEAVSQPQVPRHG